MQISRNALSSDELGALIGIVWTCELFYRNTVSLADRMSIRVLVFAQGEGWQRLTFIKATRLPSVFLAPRHRGCAIVQCHER